MFFIEKNIKIKKMKQKKIKLPLCFSCKYYFPNQGTGDGCDKVLNRWNPFKKTIYADSRCNDVIKKHKKCEYFEKNNNETFVICKDCGVEQWVENELINRAPNRKFYCWECDIKREKIKNWREAIKIQKELEKTYCKDKEHNYSGVYNTYRERVEWVCSKCGKEIRIY